MKSFSAQEIVEEEQQMFAPCYTQIHLLCLLLFTPLCEYWYVVRLPLVAAPQPFTKYRYEHASPLTSWCILVFFFMIFKNICFISRLKQVSLNLELKMRYTTAPLALLVRHATFDI